MDSFPAHLARHLDCYLSDLKTVAASTEFEEFGTFSFCELFAKDF